MDVYHYDNSLAYAGLPNHLIEERQDVIFRKVRGILNKITPETFDKLTKELVNVGLDSPRTLRGVIYLLFDKALKDLKYSSLYAKLCQELSEKSPNFEQEPGPNTFCKFLISKCEDEFERRRKATEDYDSKKLLTDEEFEHKAIVKQKMLGNIKFICELGKKRLLQEEILHECIQGLLSKKKERPIQDQAQDLECLCQIMRTIGSLLDIKASKNLMNQYFERIDLFSKKPELPSRIRFMLRDVIDLRNNNWRLRPFQREDNVPQPLSKLRDEAGYDQAALNHSIDKFGNSRSTIGISDLVKMNGGKMSMLLDDEPSFTTSSDFHWGSSFMPFDMNPFDAFTRSSAFNPKTTPPKPPAPITRMNLTTPSRPRNIQNVEPLSPPRPITSTHIAPHLSRHPQAISTDRPHRVDPPRRIIGPPNHFGNQFDVNSRHSELNHNHNMERGNRNPPLRNHAPETFSFSNESDRVLDWRSGLSNQPVQPPPPPQSISNTSSPREPVAFPNKASLSSRPPMRPCDSEPLPPRPPIRRRDFEVKSHPTPFQYPPPTSNYVPPRQQVQPPRRRIIEVNQPATPIEPITPIVNRPPSPRQAPPRRIINEPTRLPATPRQLEQIQPKPNQQYNKNNNNLHNDNLDRKEQPRKFLPPNHPPNHHDFNLRNQDNSSFQQDRGPRNNNVGRNQYNFDSPFANEADKISNWRRGIANVTSSHINNNNNNNNHTGGSPKESTQTPAQTPVLPKPTSRINDANFSLRPSHNLVGRLAVPSSRSSTNKSTNETPNDGSQSSRNPKDQDIERIKVPKENPPIAISTELNKENENDIKTHVTENNGTGSEHLKKFTSIVSSMKSEDQKMSMNSVANKIKELKIPRNIQTECLVQAIKDSIEKSELDRENTGKLIALLVPSIFEASSLLDAFRTIFDQMQGLEVEIPKVKSLVAECLSRTILDGLLSLEEVATILSGGKHHPLFLLVLQKLEKSAGQPWLHEKFVASKINLIEMLPEVDRSKDRSASILKDRCLGFLDPMLTIEPDLCEQMNQSESSAGGVYRWIKDNVDAGTQSTPSFAHVLISCVLKYINNAVTEKTKSSPRPPIESTNDGNSSESNKSTPTLSSSQGFSDLEKELLTKYQPMLQAILEDKQMQLATLYAVQTFYHGLDFPKGALLRWFHMLYDMNIVDDNVFFIWKEEINDKHPGKGQALFQVNAWLNWLAETESEEEEDV